MPDSAKTEAPTQIDGLLDRLRAQVDERNNSGQYPADLIERLDEHFKRMVYHRVERDADALSNQLESLNQSGHFSRARISVESGKPGVSQVHRVVNKTVARQTDGVLQQMQQFADDVRSVLASLVQAVHDGSTHVHTDLLTRIDSVIERLDSYERKPLNNEAGLSDLRRRVEQLEKAEQDRQFRPWFTNDSFENAFRGSPEELRDRYRDLAELFRKAPEGPIVDMGCGRGEFMELIDTIGRENWGIEIDPALAEIARDNKLQVKVGDGVEILRKCEDNSLAGISLIQVIEHLTQQQQLDLVEAAFQKLKAGGMLVIETVNPRSLHVFANAFYVDPTHTRPVHPEYLAFLQREAGFSNVETHWRNAPPEEYRLEPAGDADERRNVDRLNALLYSAADYATVATK